MINTWIQAWLYIFSLFVFCDSKDTCATQVWQLIFKSNVVSQSKWINQTFISIHVFENVVHTDKPLAICRSAVRVKSVKNKNLLNHLAIFGTPFVLYFWFLLLGINLRTCYTRATCRLCNWFGSDSIWTCKRLQWRLHHFFRSSLLSSVLDQWLPGYLYHR